jgi:carboxyl-terminal processing protease
LLVGSRTYGKGVVQRVVRLSPDLSLRLTTARWLTPRGVSLERRSGKGLKLQGGLVPDVLLDDPARRDLAAVPAEWSARAAHAVATAADSLAMYALREGWGITPLIALEVRLRAALAQMAPASARTVEQRADWVSVATRLAMVRMLEVERAGEALLRYAVRDDAALRAGVDVVAPGTDILPAITAPLPPRISSRSLGLRLALP